MRIIKMSVLIYLVKDCSVIEDLSIEIRHLRLFSNNLDHYRNAHA